MEVVRNYRMAKGLCKVCAEKWQKGHKCSAAVQLHAVQELWDIYQPEDTNSPQVDEDSSSQLYMTLSSAAYTGSVAPKTVKFLGTVQSQQALILVDSGSTHSFISSALAESLQGLSPLPTALKVAVANGNSLHCSTQLAGCNWSTQGVTFQTDFKVIPFNIMTSLWVWIGLKISAPWRYTGRTSGCCYLITIPRFCCRAIFRSTLRIQ